MSLAVVFPPAMSEKASADLLFFGKVNPGVVLVENIPDKINVVQKRILLPELGEFNFPEVSAPKEMNHGLKLERANPSMMDRFLSEKHKTVFLNFLEERIERANCSSRLVFCYAHVFSINSGDS